jgi:hypothetical protein
MLPRPQMQPHPWLRPPDRRVLTTLVCALWVAFETWHEPGGIFFWLMLAATAYATWDFFLSGNYRQPPEG